MVNSRQQEDRLAFLRSLTQEDRDFIARYGEEMWKKWKANQEFKSIDVSETKKLRELTQAKKQRLLIKIEEDILKMEKEYNQDQATIREIFDAWSASGFLPIVNQIWDVMFDNLKINKLEAKPFSVSFRLKWVPSPKNKDEYLLKMNAISHSMQKALEDSQSQPKRM